MKILNPEKDAHKTNLTLDEFGKAMARLDLSAVAPEKRHLAIQEHLTKIMVGSIQDPEVRFNLAASAVQKFRRR